MTAIASRTAGVAETIRVYHYMGTGPEDCVLDIQWKDAGGHQRGARYFYKCSWLYDKARPAHLATEIILGVGTVVLDATCPEPGEKVEFSAHLLWFANGHGSTEWPREPVLATAEGRQVMSTPIPIECEKIVPRQEGETRSPEGDFGRLWL